MLSLVGGFLLNGVRAERDVTSAAQAANTAQLIVESIKRDVRNATEVRVTNVIGDEAPYSLLVVRTIGTGESPKPSCSAWYFKSDTIRTTNTGDAAISATSPENIEPAKWTVHDQKISEIDSVSVFAVNQGSVKLSFIVKGATPVAVKTTVTPRAPSNTEGTCFAD
jgi:hypothetical protein